MGEPISSPSQASSLLTRNLELATGGDNSLTGLNDPQQLMALAAAYRTDGRFMDAVTAYDRVVEIDAKNSEAPVRLAMCLMHTGDLERADTMFQKALEFYDNVSNPELWHSLGQLYALQEKNQQAEESFNQVLDAPGLAADVHFRLAALSCANGNYDKAVDLLKKALVHCDAATEGPPAKHVWFELGDVYQQKGDDEEADIAFQNSGLDIDDHAAWHEHGRALDGLVGLVGKGGALRQKALRAMVRAVEMTKEEPEYWHSLATLHRSMETYDEAFGCLEHYSQLYVARYEKSDATTTALRASLQESGNTALSLHAEVDRLRAAFTDEKAANAHFFEYKTKMEKESESLRRLSERTQTELDKHKEWIEQMRKENRFLINDTTRIKGLITDGKKTEATLLAKVSETKKEGIQELAKVQERHARYIKEHMPVDGMKPKELHAKNVELQELADSAEKLIAEARRNAKTEIRGAEKRENKISDELIQTKSRLEIIETKLQAARDELGLLHGTPDGEAFKAAADYKAEAEKCRAQVKQLMQEVKEATEHEKLSKTHFAMVEDQLRADNEKLLERKADLAARLKAMDERNAQDVEQLRKLQAMDGHWGEKTAELETMLDVAQRERQRWQQQYEVIKDSLEGAAKAAVAHEARKVVEIVSGMESAGRAFESYLDAVLSQTPSSPTRNSPTRSRLQDPEESRLGDEASVAVEMGIQCDGVYSEFEERFGALEGVDAEYMMQRCLEIQKTIAVLLDGARDVINAQRAREAALHAQIAYASEREEAAQRHVVEVNSVLREKEIAMDAVIRKADARAEAEAEMRKFTEWKMRAKMQEAQKRMVSQQSNGRHQTIQVTQDKIAEMMMDRSSGGGHSRGGGSGSHGRPQSAHAIIQSLGSRTVDSYLAPKRTGSASRHRQRQSQVGGASKQRPRSAMSGLPPSNNRKASASVDSRVDHRHPGFYGTPDSLMLGPAVDLSASVDSLNRPQSVANVDSIVAGLEQLKGQPDNSYGSGRAGEHKGAQGRMHSSSLGSPTFNVRGIHCTPVIICHTL
jgi:tetratricopeptide (TPR) repeat protein